MKRPAHENLARQWRVLQALLAGPRTVLSISRELRVSKATIARDLDVLARVFTVETERVGKQRLVYRARMDQVFHEERKDVT